MKGEDEPITDDEWLLRFIRRERFRSDKVPLISPGAFEPRLPGKTRNPDTEGISLYREACLKRPEQILENIAVEKRGEYGIVRIQVKGLIGLNCSIQSARVSDTPGHVVIPELSASRYDASPNKLLALRQELARLASENVVLNPASPHNQ